MEQDSTFLQAETLSASDNPSSPSWSAHALHPEKSPERIPISIECRLANSLISPPLRLPRTSLAVSSETEARRTPSRSAPSPLNPLREGLIQRIHIPGRDRPPARSCLMLWSAWSCSEFVVKGSSIDNHSLRRSRSSGSKQAASTQSPESMSLSTASITGNCTISAISGASLASLLQTGCIPSSHSERRSFIFESSDESQEVPDFPLWAHSTASL